jgi:hypothetical protein
MVNRVGTIQEIVTEEDFSSEGKKPVIYHFNLYDASHPKFCLEAILKIIEVYQKKSYHDPVSVNMFQWATRVRSLRLLKEPLLKEPIYEALKTLRGLIVDSIHPVFLQNPAIVKPMGWVCERPFIEQAEIPDVQLSDHKFAQEIISELNSVEDLKEAPLDPDEEFFYFYTASAHNEYQRAQLEAFINNAPQESAALKELFDALERDMDAKVQKVRMEMLRERQLLQDELTLVEKMHLEEKEESRKKANELAQKIQELEREQLSIEISLEICKQKIRHLEQENAYTAMELKRAQEAQNDSWCTIL